MEEQDNRELELLPSSRADSSLLRFRSTVSSSSLAEVAPSVDLQLSISVGRPTAAECVAAEQIRLAAMEKAYAERVRELTRREMEMAQSEFARARQMWERAREEVESAERMKERATARLGSSSSTSSSSSALEITCHSCRQRFRPA
ncbi:hypothetical protein Ahy_B01g054311 isoform A [Arachis hypogaea]|uniref:Uncharacterized protein n=1 Tax=Arachis hypogaea TaxID=3818 RepID=A0A445ATR3_ARAHY|nr:hypothetical protein Ahy_B01g054311 isoform A [Arachis hypogaea]